MQGPEPTRRAVVGAGAGLLAALAGCTSGGGAGGATPTAEPTATDGADTQTSTPTAGNPSWREVGLTDVLSGETFAVADFEGRPVLLEFFAVWCPVCTEQQQVLRKVTDRREDLVVVSLNTDPNEDAERVRTHVESHEGFDWRYAISPSSMTRSLIDEFGSVIANPPAAPVVIVCPDGSARLLDRRGVKPADELVAAVEQC